MNESAQGPKTTANMPPNQSCCCRRRLCLKDADKGSSTSAGGSRGGGGERWGCVKMNTMQMTLDIHDPREEQSSTVARSSSEGVATVTRRGRGTMRCSMSARASSRLPNWFGLVLHSRSCRGRRGRKEGTSARLPPDMACRADRAVIRLRGGDASSSPSSDIRGNAKGAKKNGSWGLNLNVFGWGGDNEAGAEAKAERKRKSKQDMEEAEAREAMRKAREERCA